jgi:hypothetical protein
MDLELTGKVAIVGGASKGLGRAGDLESTSSSPRRSADSAAWTS